MDAPIHTPDDERIANEVLALERGAFEFWSRGDPSGFLDLSAMEVTYFDHKTPRRLDGHAALTKLYEPFRRTFTVPRYEMANPKVQLCGDAAVLTFNFNSESSAGKKRWNCTEVYARREGRWRIIHTHWALTGHGEREGAAD